MDKNIEHYLKKGMEQDMAEYFVTGKRTIIKVKPNSDFTLTLNFDNGEVRIYDCKHLLEDGTIFEILKDYNNFKRVYLDEDNIVSWDKDPNIDSNVVWSNKIDLCSDSLYVKSIPILDVGIIEIIDYLIKRRQDKGWTQQELGNATCLTQSVIARFEAKKVVPRLDTVLKIARVLDCELKVILNNKNDNDSC